MPSLNERLRQLEQTQASEDALLISLAAMEPERLAGVLRESIVALERECAEGRGDELLNRPGATRAPRRSVADALHALRGALADMEGRHNADPSASVNAEVP